MPQPSTTAEPPAKYLHLRDRYSERRTLKIFDISKSTLRRWVEEGLITAVHVTDRRLEYEVEEVERRYREMRTDKEKSSDRLR